jgi:hypothetical protein
MHPNKTLTESRSTLYDPTLNTNKEIYDKTNLRPNNSKHRMTSEGHKEAQRCNLQIKISSQHKRLPIFTLLQIGLKPKLV